MPQYLFHTINYSYILIQTQLRLPTLREELSGCLPQLGINPNLGTDTCPEEVYGPIGDGMIFRRVVWPYKGRKPLCAPEIKTRITTSANFLLSSAGQSETFEKGPVWSGFLNAGYNCKLEEFEETSRNDDTIEFAAGGAYVMKHFGHVSLEYSYTQCFSNAARQDYTEYIAKLSVRLGY